MRYLHVLCPLGMLLVVYILTYLIARSARVGDGVVPRGAGWLTLPAVLVLGQFSWYFEMPPVRAPMPGRVGAIPRGSGSHYTHLGVSGRAEARPHARGSCLDVHTELAIVCLRGSVSTYIQNWQLFVYVGAPLGSDIAGMLAPLAIVCLRGSPFGVRYSWYVRPPWQLFVYVGAPLGSDIAGMLAPPATEMEYSCKQCLHKSKKNSWFLKT